MSSFYTYTMTENDLTRVANQAKELFVKALVNNKYITKDEGKTIRERYAVVITKKGWLGTTWDKFRGVKDDKEIQMCIVKCAYLDSDFGEKDITDEEE